MVDFSIELWEDEAFDDVDRNVEELLRELDWVIDVVLEDVKELHPLKQPSDMSQ